MNYIEEEGIRSNIEERIETDISTYAAKVKPYEFIAEVFDMEKTGENVPDELREEYERLYNPEL